MKLKSFIHALCLTTAFCGFSAGCSFTQSAPDTQTTASKQSDAQTPKHNTAELQSDAQTPKHNTAELSIKAFPWADISIDGEKAGKTPVTKVLPPGTYKVEFKLPTKNKRSDISVTLKAGSSITLEYNFNENADSSDKKSAKSDKKSAKSDKKSAKSDKNAQQKASQKSSGRLQNADVELPF